MTMLLLAYASPTVVHTPLVRGPRQYGWFEGIRARALAALFILGKQASVK